MTEGWIFVCVVVINTVIAVAYGIWGIFAQSARRGQQEGKTTVSSKAGYLFRALVMLLCPVVGPVFFLVSQLLYLFFFKSKVDLTDVIFGKDKVVAQKRAEEDRERNRVPLEEALAIGDKASQRELMLDIVRGDVKNLLESISLALNSEDTETSHYAAAVLRDELNDFRQNAQELSNKIHEGGPDAADNACALIEYMNGVLAQNVFADMEQRAFVDIMEDACNYLYQSENDRYRLVCEYVEWIALQMLNIKDYERMKLWCDRIRVMYPGELAAYTVQLKLYFSIQDREKFFEVLNGLKQSDVVIDRDTLDLIRVFG